MTLIELLTVMVFIMPPAAPWSSAKVAHAAAVGYVVAVSVGLILGAVLVFVYRYILFQVFDRLLRPEHKPARRTEIFAAGFMIVFTLVTVVLRRW